MSEAQAEISGYVERELLGIVSRFRDRRAKLQPAIDAAAELDRTIPKLEKLLPQKAESSQKPQSRAGSQRDRALATIQEADEPLKPPEVARRAGIPPTSIYAVLSGLVDEGAIRKTEAGTYPLRVAEVA